MNAEHAPNPEFVRFLEWELESTIRRQKALNGTPRAARLVRSRLGTMLALAVVSMFVGGSGTYAATHRSDKVRAALYVARAEALLDIARTQRDHAARELDHVRTFFEHGKASAREAMQAEDQYVEARSAVEIRELELAETCLTGQEPNDGLAAPLVDGRDFVTERMKARLDPLRVQLKLAVEETQRIQHYAENGLATTIELNAAQAHAGDAESNLDDLEQRLVLRASFVAGELSAREVELQGMRLAAAAAREAAVRRLAVVSEQRERLVHLVRNGLAGEIELQAQEAALRTIQAEVELAELELRILDEKIAEVPEE